MSGQETATGTKFKCSYIFAFECNEEHCCESYHSRFIILLVVIALLLIALGILSTWFMPNYLRYRRYQKREDEENPEEKLVRKRTLEEAHYLRQMSIESRVCHGVRKLDIGLVVCSGCSYQPV